MIVNSNNDGYFVQQEYLEKDRFAEFHDEVATSFKEVQRQYIEGFQEQFIYDLRMRRYIGAKLWKNAIRKR